MENEILRYHLEDNTTHPKFAYFVQVDGDLLHYWLYNSFDRAISKMKALSNEKHRRVYILEPEFINSVREWRTTQTFYARNGKIFYDKFSDIGLHLKFYCDAGEWQNPEELE